MVWEATFLCLVGSGIFHQPMRQDISARRSGFQVCWARTIQLFYFPICGVPEFPWLRWVKNPSGGLGLITGLERSPGEGNGNPLQYPCLGNSTDRAVWQAIVHAVARVGQDLATKPPPPASDKPKEGTAEILGGVTFPKCPFPRSQTFQETRVSNVIHPYTSKVALNQLPGMHTSSSSLTFVASLKEVIVTQWSKCFFICSMEETHLRI